ncbi:MAG: AAA family ATPase [Acidaminobacter sp.]|uniref:ATP-binding protein n=1 Tax=Acidaminobacter sp. TaxID=1872102 RepID=UPI0013829CC0|nr:ATP-binding protein [Acidaminobacter sp.]MZQ97532.1 AAA family ATPase [Acidaminobacter sp.]
MERFIMKDLIKWKNRKDRKPLVIKGVRQCGKTYILKQFGEENYEDTAYFNFEGNPALAARFEQDLDPKRIIMELGVLIGRKINQHKTLIIFDEIQFCNAALTSLKYFYEQTPEYHIVCAGSLIGITLSKPLSFPVGKVDFLTLRPMSFPEFIIANDEEMLFEYIRNLNTQDQIPQMFADKLITLYKTYLITGGMPEVVAKWKETEDISEVERIQDVILNAYELDFAKHAPVSDIPKLSLIWKSIPDQLSKESGKFVYGHVKPGARAKDLEDALQWLINAGMVYKVLKIEKPAMPLSAYSDPSYFKLYMADTGLLRRMSRLPASSIYKDSALYTEFKGAMTENFVLNELINLHGEVPFYWKSGNTAEVDFIVQLEERIFPIEVKASTNVKSRSLGVYREKYKPEISIRSSLMNFKMDEGLLNIPLYLIWNIEKFVNS